MGPLNLYIFCFLFIFSHTTYNNKKKIEKLISFAKNYEEKKPFYQVHNLSKDKKTPNHEGPTLTNVTLVLSNCKHQIANTMNFVTTSFEHSQLYFLL